ncbi:MAG: anti-sigma factor family protein [Alphaproteobacteria bacterium]
MTTTRPSWEQLNAYVDGELSAGDAAAVARDLAGDKILAEAVATLSRLKASTQEGIEPFALAPSRPVRRPWHRMAIAASVAAGLIIAAMTSLVPWLGETAPPVWLASAWQVHGTWAQQETASPPAPVSSGVMLVALHRFGPQTYLPDLSDARLTLSHLEIVKLTNMDGDALHIGYLGNRGCQVSLILLPGSGDLSADLVRYDQGAKRGYAWRNGRRGFLLLAEGMDEDRLTLLADTLHRATLELRPFDDDTRIALRESRERSVPCLS